jgi:RNA polymerase sigma-70 factor (ECF subfamily)
MRIVCGDGTGAGRGATDLNVEVTMGSEPTPDLAAAAEAFAESRRRLFGIAYRMLGSVADAEDVVQEVWIRWQSTDRDGVLEPAAFLATITTRLSINVLQSARVRRETYIGPWLPEPVNTEADPSLGAERSEALEFAMLMLLEKLTPTERAAYVLREALDYPYERIAEIVQTSVVSARQLVSRARRHLAEERRTPAPPAEQRRLLEAFLSAAQRGDVTDLEALFASDVVSYTDGNGVKLAARIPVAGRSRVAKFVAAFSSHFWTGKSIDWVEVNGQPAATLSEDGVVTTAVTLTTSADGIQHLLWIMSPDKLRHVAPVGA